MDILTTCYSRADGCNLQRICCATRAHVARGCDRAYDSSPTKWWISHIARRGARVSAAAEEGIDECDRQLRVTT